MRPVHRSLALLSLLALPGLGGTACATSPDDAPAETPSSASSSAEAAAASDVAGDGQKPLAEDWPEEPRALTEAQWKERLSAEQYRVLREDGTELAFTGEYWNHDADGVYRCAGCGQALFSSETRFKSGTGWPSFTKPISEEAVETEVDRAYGMVRTEVVCGRCGGHQGHVFDDGPPPTGQRWCINSVSLVFDPAEGE